MFLAVSAFPVIYATGVIVKSATAIAIVLFWPLNFIWRTLHVAHYPLYLVKWVAQSSYSLLSSSTAVVGTFVTEKVLALYKGVSTLSKKIKYKNFKYSGTTDLKVNYDQMEIVTTKLKEKIDGFKTEEILKYRGKLTFENRIIILDTKKGLLVLEWYSNDDISEKINDIA